MRDRFRHNARIFLERLMRLSIGLGLLGLILLFALIPFSLIAFLLRNLW